MKHTYKSIYKTAAGNERIMLHTSMKKTLWDELNSFCAENDIRRNDFVEKALRNELTKERAAL